MMRNSLLLLLALGICACNGGSERQPAKSEGAGGGADTAAAHSAAPAHDSAAAPTPSTGDPRRFGHKSGMVKMKSQGGTSMTSTMYFDDFGAKMSTETDIHDSLNGKPLTISNISVLRDGVSVLYDPLKKVGRRSASSDAAMNYYPRFDALSAQERTQIAYKPLGKRTIAGKECEGHSFERNSIVLRVWTWDGIPLRTESQFSPSQSLVMEAESIDLDAQVPADKFDVPAGVSLTNAP